ncbi:hypothetical protein EW146_g1113 [Bondarzewia mesenterica]|uniref:Uncharacterized protein n=1 Tax=Bondarzewia mesenterica TaxID=1095465 RepID=A0A4S4M4Z4_9AGAM|nr:hypothetical protein EW146_g1113 [Bondarzewia mesenterica]
MKFPSFFSNASPLIPSIRPSSSDITLHEIPTGVHTTFPLERLVTRPPSPQRLPRTHANQDIPVHAWLRATDPRGFEYSSWIVACQPTHPIRIGAKVTIFDNDGSPTSATGHIISIRTLERN